MWVPVAVWQPCELLYTGYLLTYQYPFMKGDAKCTECGSLEWLEISRGYWWWYIIINHIRPPIIVLVTLFPIKPRYAAYNHKLRYDTKIHFNVRSKADISQLNLPHTTKPKRVKENTKKWKNGYAEKCRETVQEVRWVCPEFGQRKPTLKLFSLTPKSIHCNLHAAAL